MLSSVCCWSLSLRDRRRVESWLALSGVADLCDLSALEALFALLGVDSAGTAATLQPERSVTIGAAAAS